LLLTAGIQQCPPNCPSNTDPTLSTCGIMAAAATSLRRAHDDDPPLPLDREEAEALEVVLAAHGSVPAKG
jgi:hypothetical protein